MLVVIERTNDTTSKIERNFFIYKLLSSIELNQKKRTIDKTPPDVGKWKYYIRGYLNGEEI